MLIVSPPWLNPPFFPIPGAPAPGSGAPRSEQAVDAIGAPSLLSLSLRAAEAKVGNAAAPHKDPQDTFEVRASYAQQQLRLGLSCLTPN